MANRACAEIAGGRSGISELDSFKKEWRTTWMSVASLRSVRMS